MEERDFKSLPSILDIVNEILHLRTARIITRRMEGASLRDLSIEEGITRTEARSTEKKGLEKILTDDLIVQEDEYKYLYEQYNLEDEFFNSLPNGSRILYYLKNRYEIGLGTYEKALEDINVSSKIKAEIKQFYHADNSTQLSFDDLILSEENHNSTETDITNDTIDSVQTSSDSVKYLSNADTYNLESLPQYIRDAIDDLWTAFGACGITEDDKILEQAGFLLFLKYLDDAELKNTAESYANGTTPKNLYFDESHQNCRWSYFHNMESSELLENIQKSVIPFIKKELRVDSNITYTKFLGNFNFAIADSTQLSRIIACIDAITISSSLSLNTVLEALISKTAYNILPILLACKLLDVSLTDTVCNMFPDSDFELGSLAALIKQEHSDELDKVWNKMHFKHDMFHTYGADNSILLLSSLALLLQDIDEPDIQNVDVLNTMPDQKYNRVIAKIPVKSTANQRYVRHSIKTMVTSNLPNLMYMYACHEALENDGICILDIPHKELVDSSASHIRLRSFYLKNNILVGIIYLPTENRDLLIYKNSSPSGAYNIWFIQITDLNKEAIDNAYAKYNSRINDSSNDRGADAFMVPSFEIESTDFSLDYNHYSTRDQDDVVTYEDIEPLEDVLRHIYNTQSDIDRRISKVKDLLGKI